PRAAAARRDPSRYSGSPRARVCGRSPAQRDASPMPERSARRGPTRSAHSLRWCALCKLRDRGAMDPNLLIPKLAQPNDRKIAFVIADGLGGISGDAAGTELELADTPHLDQLARIGVTGLLDPLAPGITCGSGPGHLALFGYDPLEYDIGR